MEKDRIRKTVKISAFLVIILFAFLLGRYSTRQHESPNASRSIDLESFKLERERRSGPSLQIRFYDHIGAGDFTFEWVDYKSSNIALVEVGGKERIIKLGNENISTLRDNLNRTNFELYNKYYSDTLLDEKESVVLRLKDEEDEHVVDLPPMKGGMPPASFFSSSRSSDSESPFEPNEMEDLYVTTYNYNLFINTIKAIVYEEMKQ